MLIFRCTPFTKAWVVLFCSTNKYRVSFEFPNFIFSETTKWLMSGGYAAARVLWGGVIADGELGVI